MQCCFCVNPRLPCRNDFPVKHITSIKGKKCTNRLSDWILLSVDADASLIDY